MCLTVSEFKYKKIVCFCYNKYLFVKRMLNLFSIDFANSLKVCNIIYFIFKFDSNLKSLIHLELKVISLIYLIYISQ